MKNVLKFILIATMLLAIFLTAIACEKNAKKGAENAVMNPKNSETYEQNGNSDKSGEAPKDSEKGDLESDALDENELSALIRSDQDILKRHDYAPNATFGYDDIAVIATCTTIGVKSGDLFGYLQAFRSSDGGLITIHYFKNEETAQTYFDNNCRSQNIYKLVGVRVIFDSSGSDLIG